MHLSVWDPWLVGIPAGFVRWRQPRSSRRSILTTRRWSGEYAPIGLLLGSLWGCEMEQTHSSQPPSPQTRNSSRAVSWLMGCHSAAPCGKVHSLCGMLGARPHRCRCRLGHGSVPCPCLPTTGLPQLTNQPPNHQLICRCPPGHGDIYPLCSTIPPINGRISNHHQMP